MGSGVASYFGLLREFYFGFWRLQVFWALAPNFNLGSRANFILGFGARKYFGLWRTILFWAPCLQGINRTFVFSFESSFPKQCLN